MPDFSSHISRLKQTIETRLRPLIDNDYVLLDLPLHTNIGDTLIWQGERDFLHSIPFTCLGQGCFKTWRFPDLKPGTVILLHGGGNFGDLYPRYQDFRIRVAEHYPGHRIIVFPQSVHYDHPQFLEQDMERLRRHPDLWICTRDRESFDLLRLRFPPERILLLPDMAFCIDPERFANAPEPSRPALFVERRDKEWRPTRFAERLNRNDGSAISGIDNKDWPGTVRKTFGQWVMSRLRCWHRVVGADTVIRYADAVYRPYMLRLGIRFISRYEHIYTTRLHAAILCILLGREVTVLDNTYEKNSRFFRTWFSGSAIRIGEERTESEAA